MNERIQELSEQAQLYARQGMGKCVIELKRFDADAVLERYTKDFEEKFAELIVRECKDNFSKVWYEQGMDIRGAEIGKFLTRFDEHFGVEE